MVSDKVDFLAGNCMGAMPPLFELTPVLVRLYHFASFIVNVTHGITAFDSCRRTG